MNRIDFERSVTDFLIQKLEISNGDAQGLIEANENAVDLGYYGNHSPEETADAIIGLREY